MPGGSESMVGKSLTFTKVTRHHSGIYLCSADNGFGEPGTAQVILDVEREMPFHEFPPNFDGANDF